MASELIIQLQNRDGSFNCEKFDHLPSPKSAYIAICYANNLQSEQFAKDLKSKLINSIGSLESNKPHYYIINAPDFLIEYDNVGFQNDGNHIHAITREKGSDFGEDLLKQHLESAHKKGKN